MIVPEAIRHYADPGVDYNIQFVDYGVSIGYSYLLGFVPKILYFGYCFARILLSARRLKLRLLMEKQHSKTGFLRFAFSLAFGYNTEKFYCGLISNAESKSYGSELDVNFSKSWFAVCLSLRPARLEVHGKS